MALDETEFADELARAREKRAAALLAEPYTGSGVLPADGSCRAGCGIGLNAALIDSSDRTGLHAGCAEPLPPPSTLAAMEGALYRFDASRPRSQQTHLGPSELGTPCGRQLAMKLAGIPEKDRGLAWAPLCGTAVHGLMEDVLRAENEMLGRERYLIETALDIGEGITGHSDAFDTDTGTVLDWKYTGTTARRKASRRTVPNAQLVSSEYRVQTHLYGRGHVNAGREVRWVRVVMLARSHDYGESREWTERYRPDIARRALDRYMTLRDLVAGQEMQAHPERLETVPAAPSADTCKWCPFWQPNLKTVGAEGCPGFQGPVHQLTQQRAA